MANLLGQNIGTNYKGILNLNTLNGNLSATLQAVTDGDGNASPLQLSTTQVNVGGGTALGRLVVRGDGTNPIARFEDNSGDLAVSLTGGGSITTLNLGTAISFNTNTGTMAFSTTLGSTAANVGTIPVYSFGQGTDASISSTSNYFRILKTIAPPAGSANFRNLIIDYTINASGAQTGTATGIFLNATETALNGMTHNLMDLQTGGASKFKVSNLGATTAASFSTSSVVVGSNYISIGGDSGFLRPAANTLAISLNGFNNNHFEFRKNSDTTVVGIIKGTGDPETNITANVGSIFLRTDGGAGTSFYVKESGSGNTGWIAK